MSYYREAEEKVELGKWEEKKTKKKVTGRMKGFPSDDFSHSVPLTFGGFVRIYTMLSSQIFVFLFLERQRERERVR